MPLAPSPTVKSHYLSRANFCTDTRAAASLSAWIKGIKQTGPGLLVREKDLRSKPNVAGTISPLYIRRLTAEGQDILLIVFHDQSAVLGMVAPENPKLLRLHPTLLRLKIVPHGGLPGLKAHSLRRKDSMAEIRFIQNGISRKEGFDETEDWLIEDPQHKQALARLDRDIVELWVALQPFPWVHVPSGHPPVSGEITEEIRTRLGLPRAAVGARIQPVLYTDCITATEQEIEEFRQAIGALATHLAMENADSILGIQATIYLADFARYDHARAEYWTEESHSAEKEAQVIFSVTLTSRLGRAGMSNGCVRLDQLQAQFGSDFGLAKGQTIACQTHHKGIGEQTKLAERVLEIESRSDISAHERLDLIDRWSFPSIRIEDITLKLRPY